MIGYADALVRMPTFLPTSEDAGFLPFLMAWFNVNRVGKRTKQKSSDEETTIDEWTVSASADFSARLLQNYFNAGDALTGWVDQLDHAPPIQPGYEHMDDGDWAFNELLAWVLTVSDNVNVSNRVVKSLRTGKYNVVQRIARTNAQSTARELPRWVGKKLTEEQQEEFAELLKKAGENDTVIMTYQLRADKMRELHELTDKADLAVLRRESPTKVKKLKRKMKQIIDENKNYEPLSIALNRSGGTHGREEQVAYFRFFRFFQNSTASYTRKVPGGSIQFLPSKPADEQAVLSRLADRARQADSKNPGRSDHPAGPVSAENIAARLESMRKPKTPYSPEVAKHYKRFMAGYKDRLLILLGLEKKLAESYSLTEKEKAVMEKFLSELHGALARKANDERQPSEIRVHVGNLRDAVGKLKEKVSQLTNNSDSLDQVAPKAA